MDVYGIIQNYSKITEHFEMNEYQTGKLKLDEKKKSEMERPIAYTNFRELDN